MYLLCVFEASNKIVVIDTALEFHSLRICSNVFLSLYVFMYFFLFLCYRFSTERAGKKKFENRSTFGDDMDKSLRLTFWGPPCTYDCQTRETLCEKFKVSEPQLKPVYINQ